MFTGIIEECGRVKSLTISGSSGKIIIGAFKVLEGTNIGDSIAVNGVCLTVTDIGRNEFTADIMAETARRSSLSKLKPGASVNLERAMSANGRFGGHIVSGHIDGTGTIVSKIEEENAVWVLTKKSGDIVNLENDIIGKYVDRLINFRAADENEHRSGGLTMEMLEGF